ncbi:MAG: hypothetical protein ACP5HU_00105 [Phycisphaerae bacterium]
MRRLGFGGGEAAVEPRLRKEAKEDTDAFRRLGGEMDEELQSAERSVREHTEGIPG